MLKAFGILIVTLFLIQPLHALGLKKIWQINSGLSEPESVHYDADTQMLYISNIDGNPDQKNHKGYITKATLAGIVLEEIWTDGLNAPKGIGSDAHSLYVADIDRIVKINKNSGEIEKIYPIPHAKFLNDVDVSPTGAVYVSDMFDDAIYRLIGRRVELWLKDPGLLSPNGVYVQGNSLIVGAWGKRSKGFATTVKGQLIRISLKDKAFDKMGNKPFANCDGVEADRDNGYWVSEFTTGKIFHVDDEGNPTLILTLTPGTADLNYISEKDELLIPNMNESTVTAYKVIRSNTASPQAASPASSSDHP